MKRIIGIVLLVFSFGQMAAQEDMAADTAIQIAGAATEQTTLISPEALIDSATNDYNAGRYRQALTGYEAVMEQGFESSELYFNAGNAAYKINDLALSIWYYEKSLKLHPDDEDVIYNLGLVNSRIPDKIDVVPEMLVLQWIRGFRKMLTADGWSMVAVGLFVVALLFLALYFLAHNMALRKSGFWLGFIALLFFVVAFFSARTETNERLEQRTAIVFSPSVTIKSSPAGGSTDIFVLHEGSKVYVLENVGDWYKIKIANGSVGWLPSETIRLI